MSQSQRKFSLNQTNKSNSHLNGTLKSGKRSIPGPINPLNFLIMAIYKYAKMPLLLDIQYRIGYYLCIVSIGSVYFDLIRAPKSYFSNKYNILNQFFAKWAWGWTFSVLFCFIVTTSYIYNGGNIKRIRRNILRLLVGTSCWYVVIGIFHMIENATGECHIKNATNYIVNHDIKNKAICKRSNGVWLGFDVSGHVFLLTLCNLWICEEAKVLKYWFRLENMLNANESAPNLSLSSSNQNRLSPEEFQIAKRSFRSLNFNVKLITVIMSILSLLFDLLLIFTIVYFHNMPTKLTALFFSLACWFLSYNFLFTFNSSFLPTTPGKDLQHLLIGH